MYDKTLNFGFNQDLNQLKDTIYKFAQNEIAPLAKNVDENNVRSLLRDARGVTVVDHRANEGYVTPEEVAGEDDVYVSRIRNDPSVKNGIVFWCVGDNLRKGAALNTVQIAELLASKKIKGVPL